MSSGPIYFWLNAKLRGGKYKGKSLETVAKDDPDYIMWMIEQGMLGENCQREFLLLNMEACMNQAADPKTASGYDIRGDYSNIDL